MKRGILVLTIVALSVSEPPKGKPLVKLPPQGAPRPNEGAPNVSPQGPIPGQPQGPMTGQPQGPIPAPPQGVPQQPPLQGPLQSPGPLPVAGAFGGAGKFAPPFPNMCEENADNPSQKYYNEKCSSDSECFGSTDQSMTCQKGVCTCTENFIPQDSFLGESSTQKICTSAPYLFAPCDSVCQKPAVCKPYESSPNNKVCQCVAPYKYVDGMCMLDCKDNERYDAVLAKCLPKCKANEVKINSTCKQLVAIGGPCDDSIQCQAAYSECKGNKCTCRPGFKVTGDLCVTEMANCPNGDPLKGGNGFKTCMFSEVTHDSKNPPLSSTGPVPMAGGARMPLYPYPMGELKDDCPDTHFCLPTGGDFALAGSSGICCPKLKTECPFGKPHPNASCTWTGGPNNQFCPGDTHYCYSITVGSNTKQNCCPKECGLQSVEISGKCYPTAALSEACTSKLQCTDPNADCINGVCKCADGTKEEGGQVYKYCSRQCKTSQTLYGNNCYDILKLGDSCQGQEWRCPTNAYCNSKQKCSCICGFFTLAQDVCAPQPVCPSNSPVFPMMGEMGGSALKVPGTISDAKKAELLKNVTFCKIKNKATPSLDKPAVDSCLKNQYCAIYVDGLGLCCTTPAQTCPDGNKPISDKPCDVNNPLSCGPSAYCYQYLQLADPDSIPSARICCRNSFGPPFPVGK